jgi:hypothetical protein
VRHPDDVLDDRAGRRRHHPDPPREEGEAALPRRREQPLAGQLLLELLEREREGPGPGRLEGGDRQLELAALLINGQPAPAAHAQPVGDLQPQAARLAREHHAIDLRLAVLEAEVEVSGAGAAAA